LSWAPGIGLEQRWPRETSGTDDVAEDLVDLWLLAGCEFVIGSAASSYNNVAVYLNGSPECRLLDLAYQRPRKLVRRINMVTRRLLARDGTLRADLRR